MARYETKWTGKYPNLCCGQWILFKDGIALDIDIPFNNGTSGPENAKTYNVYQSWSFGDDWCEHWSSYESGLGIEEWCAQYCDWLASFADKQDWESIYWAFQQNDWRSNSCGGCI